MGLRGRAGRDEGGDSHFDEKSTEAPTYIHTYIYIRYLYQGARLTCIMKALSPSLNLYILPTAVVRPGVVYLLSAVFIPFCFLVKSISDVAEDAGWLNRKKGFPERRNAMMIVSAPYDAWDRRAKDRNHLFAISLCFPENREAPDNFRGVAAYLIHYGWVLETASPGLSSN